MINLISASRFSQSFIFLLCVGIVGFSCYSCSERKQQETAQSVPTATTTAPISLPIWKIIPDSNLVQGEETNNDGMVRNVSHPTITVYPPTGKNTGVAVLVFPGGGYRALAVELEGADICKWLSSIGVTGILLKYRVPDSGPHYDPNCKCQVDPVKPMALQDAQRAMALVRHHASEWNIDPHKVGVIGFSAGGHLVADIGTNYRTRAYTPTDAIDTINCRPDFGLSIFPGHMTFHANGPYQLNAKLPVDADTPPMFILQAGNDPVDSIQNSLVYYIALRKAGVPAEYHIYAEGGHAFGINKSAMNIPNFSKLPIAGWPKLAATWLHTIGMVTDSIPANR